MAVINKVILSGVVGKEPEFKKINNSSLVNFSIAMHEKTKQKNEITQWVNLVAWGKTAEYVANYIHSGDSIFVEGKLKNSDYTDKNGAKVYKTEILVNEITFIKSSKKNAENGNDANSYNQQSQQYQNQNNYNQNNNYVNRNNGYYQNQQNLGYKRAVIQNGYTSSDRGFTY